MEAVRQAFKEQFAEGWRSARCTEAGVAAFMERHPDVSREEAGRAVILIIATTSRDDPDWTVRGLRNVPYYRVPREYGGEPEGFLTVTTDEYRSGKIS
jgi:hypothetical protein